jgi:hypothetical protein
MPIVYSREARIDIGSLALSYICCLHTPRFSGPSYETLPNETRHASSSRQTGDSSQ